MQVRPISLSKEPLETRPPDNLKPGAFFYFPALTWLAASEQSQAMIVWLPRVSVP